MSGEDVFIVLSDMSKQRPGVWPVSTHTFVDSPQAAIPFVFIIITFVSNCVLECINEYFWMEQKVAFF